MKKLYKLISILMLSATSAMAQTIQNANFELYSSVNNITNFDNWSGNASVESSMTNNGETAIKLTSYVTQGRGNCMSWGSSKGKPICLAYETIYVSNRQIVSQDINNPETIPETLNGEFIITNNIVGYGSVKVTGYVKGYDISGTKLFNDAATSGNFSIPITASKNENCTECPEYLRITLSSLENTGQVQFNTILPSLSIDNLSFNGLNSVLDTAVAPKISNYFGTNITTSKATINYQITSSKATSVAVIYSTDSTNLSLEIEKAAAMVDKDSVILTNLNDNTKYYYQIVATNQYGSTYSSKGYVLTKRLPKLIAAYNFDSSYVDVNGNNAFSTNNGVTFVADRNGKPNKAININNTGSVATIAGLPYSNSPRTISLWVKMNTFNTNNYNMIFSYGKGSNSNANGASINNINASYLGYNDNVSITINNSLANSLNVWYFYTFTYDGTNVKIYKNGNEIGSSTKNWNTINQLDEFRLGIGVGGEYWFNGSIDELRIYDFNLTPQQVNELYTKSDLINSIEDLNKETFTVYPNPSNDIVNFKGYGKLFDLQGQLLKAGEDIINISDLTNGIYLLNVRNQFVKIIKN